MSAHTPGPWVANLTPDGDKIAICGDGLVVARTTGVTEEKQANARLIAAAPDLLQVLQDMLANHDAGESIIGFETARAAIAKARGE